MARPTHTELRYIQEEYLRLFHVYARFFSLVYAGENREFLVNQTSREAASTATDSNDDGK